MLLLDGSVEIAPRAGAKRIAGFRSRRVAGLHDPAAELQRLVRPGLRCLHRHHEVLVGRVGPHDIGLRRVGLGGSRVSTRRTRHLWPGLMNNPLCFALGVRVHPACCQYAHAFVLAVKTPLPFDFIGSTAVLKLHAWSCVLSGVRPGAFSPGGRRGLHPTDPKSPAMRSGFLCVARLEERRSQTYR
jgi:hypothetical protein